jgi:alpha-D-ribose 1-methylphosphonate 5-phosphate C-P lyase
MKKIIFIFLLISMIFVDHAFAYLDPGTGSMVVQALLAGIAAAGVSIGIFRRRIGAFWTRIFGRKKNEE